MLWNHHKITISQNVTKRVKYRVVSHMVNTLLNRLYLRMLGVDLHLEG